MRYHHLFVAAAALFHAVQAFIVDWTAYAPTGALTADEMATCDASLVHAAVAAASHLATMSAAEIPEGMSANKWISEVLCVNMPFDDMFMLMQDDMAQDFTVAAACHNVWNDTSAMVTLEEIAGAVCGRAECTERVYTCIDSLDLHDQVMGACVEDPVGWLSEGVPPEFMSCMGASTDGSSSSDVCSSPGMLKMAAMTTCVPYTSYMDEGCGPGEVLESLRATVPEDLADMCMSLDWGVTTAAPTFDSVVFGAMGAGCTRESAIMWTHELCNVANRVDDTQAGCPPPPPVNISLVYIPAMNHEALIVNPAVCGIPPAEAEAQAMLPSELAEATSAAGKRRMQATNGTAQPQAPFFCDNIVLLHMPEEAPEQHRRVWAVLADPEGIHAGMYEQMWDGRAMDTAPGKGDWVCPAADFFVDMFQSADSGFRRLKQRLQQSAAARQHGVDSEHVGQSAALKSATRLYMGHRGQQ
jgi:hypothetical protein